MTSIPKELPAEPVFGTHDLCTVAQITEIGQAFAGVPVPTLFDLVRTCDINGVSGRGRIAHGLIFPGHGGAVYQWHSEMPPFGWPVPIRQYGLFDSIAEVIAVHGHQGATVLRTMDPTSTPQAGDAVAFAVRDESGDIPEWGVHLPATDQAVTWAPPITPISGRYQADRHTRWRSFPEMCDRISLRTGPGKGRIVWLDHPEGRALVRATRGAALAGLRHATKMRAMALRAAPMISAADLDAAARSNGPAH